MKGHGPEKFSGARLIATSANRAWSLLSAELRYHPIGEIGAFTPQNASITQTIRDTNAAFSIRASGGVRQKVVAIPGTIWLCPAGIREEATQLSGDMPEVLHVICRRTVSWALSGRATRISAPRICAIRPTSPIPPS